MALFLGILKYRKENSLIVVEKVFIQEAEQANWFNYQELIFNIISRL